MAARPIVSHGRNGPGSFLGGGAGSSRTAAGAFVLAASAVCSNSRWVNHVCSILLIVQIILLILLLGSQADYWGRVWNKY